MKAQPAVETHEASHVEHPNAIPSYCHVLHIIGGRDTYVRTVHRLGETSRAVTGGFPVEKSDAEGGCVRVQRQSGRNSVLAAPLVAPGRKAPGRSSSRLRPCPHLRMGVHVFGGLAIIETLRQRD